MSALDKIQIRIKKLQQKAEAMIAKQASSVLSDIRVLMDRYGLTTADIDGHGPHGKRKPGKAAAGKVGRAAKGVKAGQAKGKLPPKYRDPKTGATWSGHARAPEWIKHVKDRSVFLLDGATEERVSAVAPGKKMAAKKAGVKKAVAVKKAAAKKMPAKKATVKKTVAKKAPTKKAAAKKAGARKAMPKPAAEA